MYTIISTADSRHTRAITNRWFVSEYSHLKRLVSRTSIASYACRQENVVRQAVELYKAVMLRMKAKP